MLKNDLLDRLHHNITKHRDNVIQQVAYSKSTDIHEVTYQRGWLNCLDDILQTIKEFDEGLERDKDE